MVAPEALFQVTETGRRADLRALQAGLTSEQLEAQLSHRDGVANGIDKHGFAPLMNILWSSDGDARTEDEIVDVLAGMSELVLSLPPADRDRHLAAPDGYGANLLHLAATAWTWREPDEQRLLLVQRLLLAVLAAAPGALHLRVPGPYVLLKQDAGGAMPLHLAAIVDSPLVAGFLIQHGANINATMPGPSARTPLQLAALNGSVRTAQLLLDAGAAVPADLLELVASGADLDENKRAVDERLLLLRVVWASPLVPARNDAELSRLLARVEATWRQNIPSRMFDVRHQNAMHLKYVAAPRKQLEREARAARRAQRVLGPAAAIDGANLQLQPAAAAAEAADVASGSGQQSRQQRQSEAVPQLGGRPAKRPRAQSPAPEQQQQQQQAPPPPPLPPRPLAPLRQQAAAADVIEISSDDEEDVAAPARPSDAQQQPLPPQQPAAVEQEPAAVQQLQQAPPQQPLPPQQPAAVKQEPVQQQQQQQQQQQPAAPAPPLQPVPAPAPAPSAGGSQQGGVAPLSEERADELLAACEAAGLLSADTVNRYWAGFNYRLSAEQQRRDLRRLVRLAAGGADRLPAAAGYVREAVKQGQL